MKGKPGLGSDQTIEITPAPPQDKGTLLERTIRRSWRMSASVGDGTLTLAEDRPLHAAPQERNFALPATGQTDAVTTVCLVTWPYEAVSEIQRYSPLLAHAASRRAGADCRHVAKPRRTCGAKAVAARGVRAA
jgi:hypothetical protein